MLRRTTIAVASVASVALLLGACSSDRDTSAPTSTTAAVSTTTTASAGTLEILVTNDDGIGAPGIAALVTAVKAMDNVEVDVVAPAENQSGTGDKTTPGKVAHHRATTATGVVGTAVDGFPADAVNVAIDELGHTPDLVLSGINKGQNVGPVAYISGTVGAARTAARRGIPAVAGSAGTTDSADYAGAARLLVDWVVEHRSALVAGTLDTGTVTSFNVPDCSLGGSMKDVLEVPLAPSIPDGADPFRSNCSVEPATAPKDDVSALIAGHAAETQVPLDQR